MAYQLESYQVQNISTRLGRDARLKGNLRFSSSVKICGSFEGSIEAGGFLYVEEGALVKADIFADEVVIAGEIHGNVEAKQTVEMLPSCRIYGNVRAARLRVSDGVIFEGKCEMIRNADSIDIFSGNLQDLRKSLQMSEEDA